MKNNAVNMYQWCYENAHKLDGKKAEHAESIIAKNELEPADYAIQTHLNNMINFYGRDRIEEVVRLMGLDKPKNRSAA